jgi:hypothetical protein
LVIDGEHDRHVAQPQTSNDILGGVECLTALSTALGVR